MTKKDDLINAAKNGNIEVVRFLLDKGVDINSKNDSGWTALMIAETLKPFP